MMIEERVATRSRAGCSTRATVLLPWRLGRTHAANGVLTESRRASVPSKQWGGRNGTSSAQISAHSPNIAIYQFE